MASSPPAGGTGRRRQALWERNLSGQPDDPWKCQILLPLQDVETGELYVFGTTSITGRKSVGNLIAECERMQRREPDNYPRVKLAVSGYTHRDERVGWVTTPAFPVVGKTQKDGMGAPDTSAANDLSDQIPF